MVVRHMNYVRLQGVINKDPNSIKMFFSFPDNGMCIERLVLLIKKF